MWFIHDQLVSCVYACDLLPLDVICYADIDKQYHYQYTAQLVFVSPTPKRTFNCIQYSLGGAES